MSWQPSDPGSSGTDIPVEVGDVLAGKYRVERVLGAGGMGVVVAARHIELGELRAVKFLRRELIDSDEVVERFLREARAVVKLRSRHVVQVHDVGRFDTGEPFIVMEHLDGEDLDAVIERGEPTPVREGIDIVMQALAAMAEAHAAGIIHRDLKPGNLFLAREPSGEVCVKVLDFGISKIRDPDGDQNMRMTATDAIMGTPYYMSPEQMMSTRDVDERTDIWSIGVVLYELLSKRLPFKGNNIAAQCRLLLQMDPEPLAPTSGEVLPEGFQQAVVKFLLRDPRERYLDVLEAAEALAQYGGPVSARALEAARRALAGRRTGAAARTSGAGAIQPAAIASKAASMGHISRPTLDKDSGGVSHPGTLGEGGVARAAMGHAPTIPSGRGADADEQMSRSTRASWQTLSPTPVAGRSRRGVVVGMAAALVLVSAGVLVVTLGAESPPQSEAAGSDLTPTSVRDANPSAVVSSEPTALPSSSASVVTSASAAASASAAPTASAIANVRVGPTSRPPATTAVPPVRPPPPPPAPPPTNKPAPASKGDPFGSGRH